MTRKFLLAVMCICGFVLYLSSCSKQSEDKLAGATTCDTTNVTYSTQIVNILNENCYECHKGSGLAGSGGIDLGDYTHFKAHVDNGDIRSAITHDGKVTPMPYLRAQLPGCEIETILAWINAGAQNN
jgi:mono/diheme cytochrome c family protein